MDTKLATQQIRITEWAAIIRDRKASGLKVDEYCDQHGLSRNAYFYWLRKVKEAALEQAGFVEMPALSENTIPAVTDSDLRPQMTIRLGNIKLDINNDTPTELLQRVLAVMKSC